jgi:hypothetical protein
MRQFINVLSETVDEYSLKGHADQKIKPNAPRFADNPMQDDPDDDDAVEIVLDEYSIMGRLAKVDRLHDLLADAGISDQEIKQGVKLTDVGLHKVAAALGVGPDDIRLFIQTLTQQLRDADKDEMESDLGEAYRQFMDEDEMLYDDDSEFAPGERRGDHLSAETDYLGDVTVRSAQTGKSKFYQGSAAAGITKALQGADDEEKQAVLAPLMEKDVGYADEIASSNSGTYNFPWTFRTQHGFATAQFSSGTDGEPKLKLLSVRDSGGDEMPPDRQMHAALLVQAREFIAQV